MTLEERLDKSIKAVKDILGEGVRFYLFVAEDEDDDEEGATNAVEESVDMTTTDIAQAMYSLSHRDVNAFGEFTDMVAEEIITGFDQRINVVGINEEEFKGKDN